MRAWFPPRVYEAFPFQPADHYVDGIGDPSYLSFPGDTAHAKIEAATAVHL